MLTRKRRELRCVLKIRTMFKNSKGQINLVGLFGIGITIAIATIGGFMAQNYRSDNKLDIVKTEVNINAQRTAKLEEAIQNLKTDNAEIKKDIKTILQILK